LEFLPDGGELLRNRRDDEEAKPRTPANGVFTAWLSSAPPVGLASWPAASRSGISGTS
jgi:hypothetical protein